MAISIWFNLTIGSQFHTCATMELKFGPEPLITVLMDLMALMKSLSRHPLLLLGGLTSAFLTIPIWFPIVLTIGLFAVPGVTLGLVGGVE